MAPKAKEPVQKLSRTEAKALRDETIANLMVEIADDYDAIGDKIYKMGKLIKEMTKKKENKPLKPIPVPEAIAKFITQAIKNKKLSDDMMNKMDYNSKTTITAKDDIDRLQVSAIIWDYIKKNCKSAKNDEGKPVYTCDTELKNLLKVDEFKLTNFQTYFGNLYPKSDKKRSNKKKDDSDSGSDSDSDSGSDSGSDSSSSSDSESEEEEKTKAKPKPKAVTKKKA